MCVDKDPLELVGFARAPSGSADTIATSAACARLTEHKLNPFLLHRQVLCRLTYISAALL